MRYTKKIFPFIGIQNKTKAHSYEIINVETGLKPVFAVVMPVKTDIHWFLML